MAFCRSGSKSSEPAHILPQKEEYMYQNLPLINIFYPLPSRSLSNLRRRRARFWTSLRQMNRKCAAGGRHLDYFGGQNCAAGAPDFEPFLKWSLTSTLDFMRFARFGSTCVSQRGDPLHFPNWPVWAFRFRSVRWLVVEKIPYAKFYFECERPNWYRKEVSYNFP